MRATVGHRRADGEVGDGTAAVPVRDPTLGRARLEAPVHAAGPRGAGDRADALVALARPALAQAVQVAGAHAIGGLRRAHAHAGAGAGVGAGAVVHVIA